MERCPTCNSHNPDLHPACQAGGEVAICKDAFHSRMAIPESMKNLRGAVFPEDAVLVTDSV